MAEAKTEETIFFTAVCPGANSGSLLDSPVPVTVESTGSTRQISCPYAYSFDYAQEDTILLCTAKGKRSSSDIDQVIARYKRNHPQATPTEFRDAMIVYFQPCIQKYPK